MIDDSYYKRLRQIESKGNYNARNASGAWGGYQFMPQIRAALWHCHAAGAICGSAGTDTGELCRYADPLAMSRSRGSCNGASAGGGRHG